MDLRHLRYFVAVAEEGHFGRAAERLHIVQPALSMQIKALEEEVGGQLFARTSRKVELTEAGRMLLVEARRTLDQAGHTLDVVRRSVRGELGIVRVGFAGYAALTGQLMRNLTAFHQQYPNAELELHEIPPHDQPAAILAGQLDVGYWPNLSNQLDSRLIAEPIGAWPLTIALASDHSLASRDELTTADIADNPLILYAGNETEYGPMSAVEQLIQLQPTSIHRVSSTLTVLSLAAAGLGLAPVPDPIRQVSIPNLVYRKLKGDGIMSQLMLLRRATETGGAVKAFLELACREIT